VLACGCPARRARLGIELDAANDAVNMWPAGSAAAASALGRRERPHTHTHIRTHAPTAPQLCCCVEPFEVGEGPEHLSDVDERDRNADGHEARHIAPKDVCESGALTYSCANSWGVGCAVGITSLARRCKWSGSGVPHSPQPLKASQPAPFLHM
jgi:hypothetical protein